jgi:hypothetical protein
MPKLFEISDLKVNRQKADPSGMMADSFLQLHEHKIEGLKQLAGKLPLPGEAYFLWTVKSFNAFTFIPYIIRQEGSIRELTISTYSISIRIIDALMKLISKEMVSQVHLLVSETLRYRLPKVHDHLMSLTRNNPAIQVFYGWNHSKIALILTDTGHYIVEGSGNFGENAQHEQYLFLNSQKIYEFRKTEILAIHTQGN